MIFVFLAYGGWSDAATPSAEMRDARHGITRALLTGLALVMGLYLLANWAYLLWASLVYVKAGALVGLAVLALGALLLLLLLRR